MEMKRKMDLHMFLSHQWILEWHQPQARDLPCHSRTGPNGGKAKAKAKCMGMGMGMSMVVK